MRLFVVDDETRFVSPVDRSLLCRESWRHIDLFPKEVVTLDTKVSLRENGTEI